MRKLRFLLPLPGLVLVLAVVLTLCPRPAAASFEELYARRYPKQMYVGPDLDLAVYDYPRLLEQAGEVLVVTPETELAPGGTGFSLDRDYTGTNLRLKYRFWDARTWRRVKVLRVIKGAGTEPGDTVGVWDRCVLTEDEHLLARQAGSWPMMKGCVYLLFLDKPAASNDARSIAWNNGWFDLTHLSLNDPFYLPVLTAALADNDLLSQRRAAAPGEGADAQGKDLILTTPWTEKGYALSLRRALVEEAA